ncbi:MAG: DNA repair protein RadA [Lachnospiraceae bacterium]|nr:DNA repair protein RadA [Lachnospiraceae bacterium]
MAKAAKTVFFCKECGYESGKWLGQCPGCFAWNSFVEAPQAPKKAAAAAAKPGALLFERPKRLSEIESSEEDRTGTGFGELDRVLGGGLVKGSLILVGGDPGIGKSTLLLQVCRNLSANEQRVLYISGEESFRQIKMRADRIGSFSENLTILCETSLDRITEVLQEEKPNVAVVDSIQTMYKEDVDSAAGSVSQVREGTNLLMQIAKGLGITIFLIGHVTKEGVVAGPRTLEHMVDTVLYFEGEKNASYRIIRGVKNRFGATNEIGVFEMAQEGLREVKNPSEYMLSGRPLDASGSVVSCSMEGTRPILVEIQGLVCKTNFGLPRRTAAGVDYNRMNLLLAVLEKRAGLHMSECDAYVNLAGGVKITEPAMDLGIVMALVSSYKDRPVDDQTIIFGEVGLAGEIRSVNMAQARVREAAKLGFTTCILPKSNLKGLKEESGNMRLVGVQTLREAIGLL